MKNKLDPSQLSDVRLIDLLGEDLRMLISDIIKQELREFSASLLKAGLGQVEYLTRKETASRLKVTLPTLREYTKQGRIKDKKIGGRVLYSSDDVDKALREQPKYARK